MENEKGFYVALGVYMGELQKRADLKNDEICKSVHIGHSTFNDLKGAKRPLSDYVKVVECCLDAFNEGGSQGLSGMNGGECIFDTGEEKRRREENGENR